VNATTGHTLTGRANTCCQSSSAQPTLGMTYAPCTTTARPFFCTDTELFHTEPSYIQSTGAQEALGFHLTHECGRCLLQTMMNMVGITEFPETATVNPGI